VLAEAEEAHVVFMDGGAAQGGGYEIASGSQRVRAARQLGSEEIPCLVRDLRDKEAVARLIDANIRARIAGPMEVARAQALGEARRADRPQAGRV